MQAAQALWRAPAFTIPVVLAVALGVGGSAAVWSVLDRLLFKPAAGVQAPSQLWRVYVRESIWGNAAFTKEVFGYPDYQDFANAMRGTVRIEAYSPGRRIHRETGRPVAIAVTSPGFLEMLGVRAHIGRSFEINRVPPAGIQEALISFGFWSTILGSDSSTVGRTLVLDGQPVAVIGVTPPAFRGLDLDPVDIWLKLSPDERHSAQWLSSRDSRFLSLVARVNPETDRESVSARLTTVYRRAHAEDQWPDPQAGVLLGKLPPAQGPGELLPLEARNLSVIKRLSAVSAIVLVVVAANCASLLLARAVRRRREIGIRLALGLSRIRLATLLCAELLVLTGLAAVASIIIATWASGALQVWLLSTVQSAPVAVDHRVLVASVSLALLAVIGTGAAPALFLLRTKPTEVVSVESTSLSRAGARFGGAVIAAQTALSVALVSLAGTFLVSMNRIMDKSSNYHREYLTAIAGGGLRPANITGIMSSVRSLGFVESTSNAIADVTPGRAMTRIAAGGTTTPRGNVLVSYNAVDTAYFSTVGLKSIAGRLFTSDDRAGASPVVVVTDATAKAFWPGEQAVGQCVFAFGESCRRVVGVVPDVRWDLAKPPVSHFYLPLAQSPAQVGRVIVVRSRVRSTAAQVSQLERAVAAADSAGIATQIYSITDRFERQVRPLVAASIVLLVYAVVVLCTAVVGMYGRVSYEVEQRTREFGIRAALGAAPSVLLALVLSSGMRVFSIGVAAGIVLVGIAGPLLERFLFDTTATNPVVIGAVVATLLATSVTAMVIAARRATALSPAVALRSQ